MVEPQDHGVAFSHDEQCRRGERRQLRCRQIWPTTAGNHRRNVEARVAGRHQRRSRARAGAEVADGKRRGVRSTPDPPGDVDEPGRQNLDGEHVGAVGLLGRREQVEQQRGETRIVHQRFDAAVAHAVPTTTTALGENDDPAGSLRNRETTVKLNTRRREFDPLLKRPG